MMTKTVMDMQIGQMEFIRQMYRVRILSFFKLFQISYQIDLILSICLENLRFFAFEKVVRKTKFLSNTITENK